MELREPIEDINKKLLDRYGKWEDGRPNFKVVWSDDEYEKRWTAFTDEGFELIQPEIRLLPKFKQYLPQRYLLVRLVPVVGETDLTEKTSYECAWAFQDKHGNYLPPFFDGCVHVIESMLSVMDKANTHIRYKDKNVTEEERLAHIVKVEKELFGNETEVGDALNLGYGVTVDKESETKTVH